MSSTTGCGASCAASVCPNEQAKGHQRISNPRSIQVEVERDGIWDILARS